jgi:hypothetical protein
VTARAAARGRRLEEAGGVTWVQVGCGREEAGEEGGEMEEEEEEEEGGNYRKSPSAYECNSRISPGRPS